MVNLRSQCLKSFKKNFSNFYQSDQSCPLCGREPDIQEHALQCETVKENMTIGEQANMQKVEYMHMDGSAEQQARLASVYINILSIRERFLDETPQLAAHQGIILDQATREADVNLVTWK